MCANVCVGVCVFGTGHFVRVGMCVFVLRCTRCSCLCASLSLLHAACSLRCILFVTWKEEALGMRHLPVIRPVV